MPIEQVIGTSYPWCSGWATELKELFAAYVEAKQRQNVLDYDDLLLYWAQMVGDANLADDIGGRFDHVLVDEYQDTNRLQSSILLALKPSGRGLTVVGDDAQSIYSFRAATVRNILDFPDQFSPPANIITLDRNYRSTQTILAAANGVIGLAKERFTKNLWTELLPQNQLSLNSPHHLIPPSPPLPPPLFLLPPRHGLLYPPEPRDAQPAKDRNSISEPGRRKCGGRFQTPIDARCKLYFIGEQADQVRFAPGTDILRRSSHVQFVPTTEVAVSQIALQK